MGPTTVLNRSTSCSVEASALPPRPIYPQGAFLGVSQKAAGALWHAKIVATCRGGPRAHRTRPAFVPTRVRNVVLVLQDEGVCLAPLMLTYPYPVDVYRVRWLISRRGPAAVFPASGRWIGHHRELWKSVFFWGKRGPNQTGSKLPSSTRLQAEQDSKMHNEIPPQKTEQDNKTHNEAPQQRLLCRIASTAGRLLAICPPPLTLPDPDICQIPPPVEP